MKQISFTLFIVILFSLFACEEPKKEVEKTPLNDKYTFEVLEIAEDNFLLFQLNTHTGKVFVRNGKNGSWYEATENNQLKTKRYNVSAYELHVQKVADSYRLELCNKIDGSVVVRSQSSAWYDASIK